MPKYLHSYVMKFKLFWRFLREALDFIRIFSEYLQTMSSMFVLNSVGLPRVFANQVAHCMDKFVELIPTGPKVIRPNTLNCAPIFLEFCFPRIFVGTAQIFGPYL